MYRPSVFLNDEEVKAKCLEIYPSESEPQVLLILDNNESIKGKLVKIRHYDAKMWFYIHRLEGEGNGKV